MVRCVKPRWWPVLTLAEKAGACWAGLLPRTRAVLSLPHRNVARQLDATNRGLGGRRGFLAIRSCTYGDNGRRVIVEDADGGDDTRPAIGGI